MRKRRSAQFIDCAERQNAHNINGTSPDTLQGWNFRGHEAHGHVTTETANANLFFQMQNNHVYVQLMTKMHLAQLLNHKIVVYYT